jgi:hypothetical protein
MTKVKKKYKEYPETHFQGLITLDNPEILQDHAIHGDIGVQISSNGRIWICINGISFIRFTPKPKQ